jgi:hypothetical protein
MPNSRIFSVVSKEKLLAVKKARLRFGISSEGPSGQLAMNPTLNVQAGVYI